MSAHAEKVAQQIAALHAVAARTRIPEPPRLMTDEEIAWERILDASAEERKYDREHMSDRDADYEADRYENRTERWSA